MAGKKKLKSANEIAPLDLGAVNFRKFPPGWQGFSCIIASFKQCCQLRCLGSGFIPSSPSFTTHIGTTQDVESSRAFKFLLDGLRLQGTVLGNTHLLGNVLLPEAVLSSSFKGCASVVNAVNRYGCFVQSFIFCSRALLWKCCHGNRFGCTILHST